MAVDRRVFLAGMGAALVAAPARAVEAAEAERFVRALADELETVLRSASPADPQADRVLAILRQHVALQRIARYTAKPVWPSMSAGQRAAFVEAFERFLARGYANSFEIVEDRRIEIREVAEAGRKGVVVRSALVHDSAPEIPIDWLVSDRGGRTQVVAIMAKGISLSITLREIFSAMLKARGGDIDAFIGDLRSRALS